MVPTLRAFLFIAVVLLAGACGETSRTPISPDPATALGAKRIPPNEAPQGSVYPLDSGNRWHYQRAFSVRTFADDGTLLDAFTFESEIERVQSCIETWEGRDYLVERQTETSPTQEWKRWILYRQDAGGLYEADEGFGSPPACATSPAAVLHDEGPEAQIWHQVSTDVGDSEYRAAFEGARRVLQARIEVLRSAALGVSKSLRRRGGAKQPQEGELLRLSYPLHLNKQWFLRPDHDFQSTVESNDVLDLEPGRLRAWRLRFEFESLGPNDVVHAWYGALGFLRLAYHIESDAIDHTGKRIGTLIAEELMELDEIDLVGPGRF